jgi:hypothetical protein
MRNCWVPFRVRAIGDKVVFPKVAGHKPTTTSPVSWCSRATAELLVERFTGRDARHGAGLVIGATIPGETVGVFGATVRIGRIAITDGWAGSPGAEIYSEQAVRITELLGTATERHCDSNDISLLFAYLIVDTEHLRALETVPGTRLILSELWAERTEPVSDTELNELRPIDRAMLRVVIGVPRAGLAPPGPDKAREPQPPRRRQPRKPASEPAAEVPAAAPGPPEG